MLPDEAGADLGIVLVRLIRSRAGGTARLASFWASLEFRSVNLADEKVASSLRMTDLFHLDPVTTLPGGILTARFFRELSPRTAAGAPPAFFFILLCTRV